jgi:putative Holliday junction resolvase
MNDDESAQSKAAREYAAALAETTGLPVELYDERLTSFEADELMAGSGWTKKKRKARRDSIAAQRILTGWLAGHRTPRPESESDG